jgi:hypothetical protein
MEVMKTSADSDAEIRRDITRREEDDSQKRVLNEFK